MNKVNTNETLSRMKSLMNYGLQTEGKQAPYSAVEYQKVGADGKVYGIVREGTKYYIKTAPNKQNLLKEDFGYIGGFRNRKENEYGNFALAQKQFDLKMMSLKEAANNPNFNVESWDLDKKEMVVTEASDKMKGEILRERQIMKNAMLISEKKMKECNLSVGDEVVGMQLSTQGEALLIVSENGLGKRTLRKEFPLQKRGGKGVKCYKITDKTGDVVGVKAVNEDHEVMMITTEGIIIQLRCDEISTYGRITSGVKLINLKNGVTVAKLAKVRQTDKAETVDGEVVELGDGEKTEAQAESEEKTEAEESSAEDNNTEE